MLKKINHPLILLAVSSILFLLSLSNIFSSCFHYSTTGSIIDTTTKPAIVIVTKPADIITESTTSSNKKVVKQHVIIKNKPEIKKPIQTFDPLSSH